MENWIFRLSNILVTVCHVLVVFCFRPVMAIVDIEVLQCNDDRRSATLKAIIDQLGPTDGTVMLELESGNEFSDDLVNEIVDTFGDYGEIILVR